MTRKKKPGLDYTDPDVRAEILDRQRRDMWTPEQIASLAKHFRLRPGMVLLDAGCGHGYSLRTFGPYCLPGGRLVGVDREPHLLETAEEMARKDGVSDAAEFQTGDLYALPFGDGTFDAIMVQVVMCHLAEPERALDELIRVAKRGGCIAVFDNAVNGFDEGWDSTSRSTVKQLLLRCEEWMLASRGRKKLGRGDWAVGLRMPAWMEARGLKDVDARVNEQVRWFAPPYRSPGQQNAIRHARERAAEDGFDRMHHRNTAEEMRAAGADEGRVRSAIRSLRRREHRFRDAVADGTAAMAYGGSFWCVWGFKP